MKKNKKFRVWILFVFVFIYSNINSQPDSTNKRQTFPYQSTFLKNIAEKNKITIFYFPDSINHQKLNLKGVNKFPDYYLFKQLKNYNYSISSDSNSNYFIFKNFQLKSDISKLFESSFKNNHYSSNNNIQYISTYDTYISKTLIIDNKRSANNNEQVLLEGIISRENDKAPIYQATINIIETETVIETNKKGYFKKALYPGTYTLKINSVGMYERSFKVILKTEGMLNITLKTKPIEIDEITISASKNDNIKNINLGFEKISSKSIKEIPTILGEKDIIKIALLLPGVQSVSELSAGFNVRGSPADQNMFYINNLPVYNSSHVFGLFTTFNSDAIDDFTFYKSSIPTEFGGSLSSIFKIKAKEGNYNKFSARGGIGISSGSILFEGPIIKEKASILVSLRSSYSNWILKKIKNTDVQNSYISFYDALSNFSYKINKKNKLNIFFYTSNDTSDLAFGIRNKYSNKGGSLVWKHKYSNTFRSEFSIIKSQYSFEETNYETEYLTYNESFDLNHNESKLNFIFKKNQSFILTNGLNLKYYTLLSGNMTPVSSYSLIDTVKYQNEKGAVGSVFSEAFYHLTPKLSVKAGLRFSIYTYLGPHDIYIYRENLPLTEENIIDTVSYKNFSIIKPYHNFDYRLSLKYNITKTFSFKTGYNTIHQYLFMMSNTINISPTNKWKLSDPYLKPLSGQQISAGIYKNFLNNKLKTSVEVYSKTIKNLNEFKDGANIINTKNAESNIIQGTLDSKGIELFVKLSGKRLNGWINYTFSKTEILAINKTTGENNNRGNKYTANYDRPNALNFTLNYKISKRINFSTNIVYASGRPITYPVSVYYIDNIQLTGFSNRNEYRIEDYFRTDISINIEGNLKKQKFAHSSWSFGIYNLFGRKNPYNITFYHETGIIKAYKTSILGAVIPSVSYNLKLGNYED